jgi:hypothetical protein
LFQEFQNYFFFFFQAVCRSSYKKQRRTAGAASVDGGVAVAGDRCSRELSSSISRKSNWEVIEHYNTR